MDRCWGYGSEVRQREENQDCYGLFEFPAFTLAIVCDGMGGHVGGAQASKLAVRTIHDALRESSDDLPIGQRLRQAIEKANSVIYEASRRNHRLMGMGTTVVAAAIEESHVHMAHVGDSRAYLINDGQAVQVTRDHTMVNLFVDAELLSPEDAATHPEAHVLSRSLGVERTVEVETTEPIELAEDDVVLLCSDGVHGVVTEWEMGQADWSSPSGGIRHLLEMVGARNGDDNATAVCVMIGTALEDVPATPVPEPDDLSSVGSAPSLPPIGGMTSGPNHTIVPDEEFLSPIDDDFVREPTEEEFTEHSAPPMLIEPENPVLASPPPAPPRIEPTEPSITAPSVTRPTPSEPTPPPTVTSPTADAPPDLRKPKQAPAQTSEDSGAAGKIVRLVAVAGAGLALLTIGAGLLALVVQQVSNMDFSETPAVTAPEDDEVIMAPLGEEPTEAGPDDSDTDAEGADDTDAVVEADTDPPSDTDAVTAEEGDEGPSAFFAPSLPATPRRLPHRPARYTQPPPGGVIQYSAVQAARSGDCFKALRTVTDGIESSPDNAGLYSQVWYCFTESHQKTLENSVAEDFEGLAKLERHFSGRVPLERDQSEADKALLESTKRHPNWGKPAWGGTELRLQAWSTSTNVDLLAEVIADLIGEPSVADHIAKDVLLEAAAVKALTSMETPTKASEELLARRVYWLARSLDGPIGGLLTVHRPEIIPQLEATLNEATGEDAPKVVLDALKVAKGELDMAKVSGGGSKGPRKPSRPEEPDLGGEDQGGTVFRR